MRYLTNILLAISLLAGVRARLRPKSTIGYGTITNCLPTGRAPRLSKGKIRISKSKSRKQGGLTIGRH